MCNGINVKDMLLLKYKNISDEEIIFRREKTKQTSEQDPKNVQAVLLPELKQIIEKWGNKPKSPNQYVFPVLKHGMTAKKQFDTKTQAVKMINTYMKRTGEKLEIKSKITTYTARHTFACMLNYNGASISFISESLNQASVKTTESYLESFGIDEKKKWAGKLLEL
jgi:integrase/recombinase XerD